MKKYKVYPKFEELKKTFKRPFSWKELSGFLGVSYVVARTHYLYYSSEKFHIVGKRKGKGKRPEYLLWFDSIFRAS